MILKSHTCNLMFSYINTDNDSENGNIVSRTLTGIDFIPNKVRISYALDVALNSNADFKDTYIGTLRADFLRDGLNSINAVENILLVMKKTGNEPIQNNTEWINCFFKEINTNKINMRFKSQAYTFNFLPVLKTGIPITWNAGMLYVKLEFVLFQEDEY